MRNLVTLLILIVWGLVGWYYKAQSDLCCQNQVGTISNVAKPAESGDNSTKAVAKPLPGPLTFNWSDQKPITSEGWTDYKTQLLNNLSETDRLQINGRYFSNESNNTTYENLGLARAAAARKLFAELEDGRIVLTAEMIDNEGVPGDKGFESVGFRTLITTKEIVETANSTVIRFPYNSTNKLNSMAVEQYLDKVAERVKASGEKIMLVGHTDNTDSESYNLRLGQRRADVIKDYLVARGVDAMKITATSKGESEPMAPNDSRAGRAQNRRTELTISK